MDVELDEVAFRSVGRPGGIIWLRYLAAARRGSGKIWPSRLPYRITQACQGGGGPISIDEMNQALLLFSDEPVLGEGSVCHTDGAKAHKTLASPSYDGSLEKYSLKLSHTCVRHKPPYPEFSKEMSVLVWSGSEFVEEIRIGGTQKLDGFFASFRRLVGRKPLNSVGRDDSQGPRMEQLMHFAVRSLKFWFSGSDMFVLHGKLRKLARTDPSAVNWEALSDFKLAFDVAAEPGKPSVQNEGLGSSAESELFDED